MLLKALFPQFRVLIEAISLHIKTETHSFVTGGGGVDNGRRPS